MRDRRLLRADDDAADDRALLHVAAGERLLDGADDDVADAGHLALELALARRAAKHLDAHRLLRAGVVGDVEIALLLNHDSYSRVTRASRPCLPLARADARVTSGYRSSGALPVITSSAETWTAFSGAFWTMRSRRWCLVRLSGRHSAISTRSPSRASFFSSWAWSDGAALEVLAVLRVLGLVVDHDADRLVALVGGDHALDGAEQRRRDDSRPWRRRRRRPSSPSS